jgi:SMI1-KNR4 cell-wall
MKRHLTEQLGLQGVTGECVMASLDDIAGIERELNVQLSADYKDFLLTCGASLFTKDVAFLPIQPSPWAVDGVECFDVFYGVSQDAGLDLRRINIRLKNQLPKETVAIGHDSGSNLILLAWKTNEILFLDKETGKTYLVARSFYRFLESFRLR